MAGRSGLLAPVTYVARGSWPAAVLDGPRVAIYAQLFAARLAQQIEGRTLRDIAQIAGISHSTLHAVLNGDRWPDMVTIAKLEDALNAELWPGVEARRVLSKRRA
jgi:transcriptional regulator with XRE-family HTH domain